MYFYAQMSKTLNQLKSDVLAKYLSIHSILVIWNSSSFKLISMFIVNPYFFLVNLKKLSCVFLDNFLPFQSRTKSIASVDVIIRTDLRTN